MKLALGFCAAAAALGSFASGLEDPQPFLKEELLEPLQTFLEFLTAPQNVDAVSLVFPLPGVALTAVRESPEAQELQRRYREFKQHMESLNAQPGGAERRRGDRAKAGGKGKREELQQLWRTAAAVSKYRMQQMQTQMAFDRELAQEQMSAFWDWLRNLLTFLDGPVEGSADADSEAGAETTPAAGSNAAAGAEGSSAAGGAPAAGEAGAAAGGSAAGEAAAGDSQQQGGAAAAGDAAASNDSAAAAGEAAAASNNSAAAPQPESGSAAAAPAASSQPAAAPRS